MSLRHLPFQYFGLFTEVRDFYTVHGRSNKLVCQPHVECYVDMKSTGLLQGKVNAGVIIRFW